MTLLNHRGQSLTHLLVHAIFSTKDRTAYIVNQAEHHKKFSYQEEIREIFTRHTSAFDERYVWD
jgi:hypothetical protein